MRTGSPLFVRLVLGLGSLIARFGREFGLIVLLAGVWFLGSQVYDRVTATSAVATVIKVQPACETKSCNGTCRWKRVGCLEADAREATGAEVRRTPFARLSFTGRDGRPRTAWVRFSKLERTHVDVGETIPILYRGTSRLDITLQKALPAFGTDYYLALAGGALLVVGTLGRKLIAALRSRPVRGRTPRPKPAFDARKPNIALRRKGPVERNRSWF